MVGTNRRGKGMDIQFWDKNDIMELLKIGNRRAKALLRTEGCPAVQIGNQYRV